MHPLIRCHLLDTCINISKIFVNILQAAQNLKDLEGITSEPSEDLLVLWKKCLEQIESKVCLFS